MTGALRAEIHRLRAVGETIRDIAARVGVSRSAVSRVLAAPAPVSPAEAVAAAPAVPPSALTVLEPGAPVDVLSELELAVRQCRADLDSARAKGEPTTTRERTLAVMLKALAVEQRALRVAQDTVSIPRSDIDLIREDLRQRIQAINSRPLLCSACHKSMVATFVDTHRRD